MDRLGSSSQDEGSRERREEAEEKRNQTVSNTLRTTVPVSFCDFHVTKNKIVLYSPTGLLYVRRRGPSSGRHHLLCILFCLFIRPGLHASDQLCRDGRMHLKRSVWMMEEERKRVMGSKVEADTFSCSNSSRVTCIHSLICIYYTRTPTYSWYRLSETVCRSLQSYSETPDRKIDLPPAKPQLKRLSNVSTHQIRADIPIEPLTQDTTR